MNFSVFQSVLTASFPVPGYHWKESVFIFFTCFRHLSAWVKYNHRIIEDTPELSLVQDEQSHFSLPLLKSRMLPSLGHLGGPLDVNPCLLHWEVRTECRWIVWTHNKTYSSKPFLKLFVLILYDQKSILTVCSGSKSPFLISKTHGLIDVEENSWEI